jgi:hypothetical protein
MRVRRLAIPTPEKSPRDGPEGLQAAWFRERILRLSRPHLASRLGVSTKTVERQESSPHVSNQYRLACAAVAAGLDDWKWWEDPEKPARIRRLELRDRALDFYPPYERDDGTVV